MIYASRSKIDAENNKVLGGNQYMETETTQMLNGLKKHEKRIRKT